MKASSILCVHSFWRASSTYIWNKIRARNDLYAYYEPFHEELNAQASALPEATGSYWKESSNHPDTEDCWKTYRTAEIQPCFLGQRVYGEFNTTGYLSFTESKKRQIAYLIDNALERNASQIALCFTRSLGCSPAMRSYLASIYPSLSQCHVMLRRDPLAQFSSNLRLLTKGVPIFVAYYMIAMAFAKPEMSNYLGIDCGTISKTPDFAQACQQLMQQLRALDQMGAEGRAQIIRSSLRAFLCCTMLQLSTEDDHHDVWLDVSAPELAIAQVDRLNAAVGFKANYQDFRASDAPMLNRDLFRKNCRESLHYLIETGLIQPGQGLIDAYYGDHLSDD